MCEPFGHGYSVKTSEYLESASALMPRLPLQISCSFGAHAPGNSSVPLESGGTETYGIG